MALDDPHPDEIDVTQISIPDNGNSIFMARLPGGYCRPEVAQRIEAAWKNIWKRAGHDKPPPLLVCDGSVEITALSDAELLNVGLMRVPTT
jgi:hypothetical protein